MRIAPLVLALSYALAVVLVRGAGTAAEVVALAAGYAAAIGGVTGFVAAAVLMVRLVRARRRDATMSAISYVRTLLRRRWDTDRCLSLWQPPAVFVAMMTGFTLFKQTILPRAGFGMGPAIADADRALFGTDAWRVTHGLLGSPWASQLLDLAYHAWFAPMTLGVALCAFASPGSRLATRYLLAYGLLWVGQGSLLAYWLPAAGPPFYATFQVETGRFAELTRLLADQDAYLRAAGASGLSALSYQSYLLQLFHAKAIALGGGISAMPSLHNAMAVLFACAGWRLSRPLGRGFAAYAAVIWFGSIHLGWHYALDGLVALAATLATWKATGVLCHLADRHRPEPAADLAPVAAPAVAKGYRNPSGA